LKLACQMPWSLIGAPEYEYDECESNCVRCKVGSRTVKGTQRVDHDPPDLRFLALLVPQTVVFAGLVVSLVWMCPLTLSHVRLLGYSRAIQSLVQSTKCGAPDLGRPISSGIVHHSELRSAQRQCYKEEPQALGSHAPRPQGSRPRKPLDARRGVADNKKGSGTQARFHPPSTQRQPPSGSRLWPRVAGCTWALLRPKKPVRSM